MIVRKDFNPRSLAGATSPLYFSNASSVNFNPRSLAGATGKAREKSAKEIISIHAPSRERQLVDVLPFELCQISIHAPSRERLLACLKITTSALYFNPRSLAGATPYWLTATRCRSNFNPRSLAGATHAAGGAAAGLQISIHAPSRERPTHNPDSGRGRHAHFNPRSLAGATALIFCNTYIE